MPDNAIRVSCDTYSEFNLCGVSQDYFYCNIDDVEREFADVPSAKHPGDIYDKIEKHIRDILDHLNQSKRPKFSNCFAKSTPVYTLAQDALSQMKSLRSVLSRYKELQLYVQSFAPKKIALDNIKYFKVEGSVQYLSDVTGGGVNMQGAVLGGLLAGDAGAIVGSRLNTGIRTSCKSVDNRKIILVLRDGDQWVTHNVKSNDTARTLEAFRKLMTEKEENMVKLKAEQVNSTPSLPSSAGELKTFKELLDSGIITQEEFDTKKKQLLGL